MQEKRCPQCQHPVEETTAYCPVCLSPILATPSQTPTSSMGESTPQDPEEAPPPPEYLHTPLQPLNQSLESMQPQRKRKRILLSLALGIVVLLILSSVLFVQNKNAEYQKTIALQAAATKTAAVRTVVAQAAATKTAAAGTVVAQTAVAKAVQANPYDPAMQTLQGTFFPSEGDSSASWTKNSGCVTSSDGSTYTVSGSVSSPTMNLCYYLGTAPTNYTLELHMQFHGDTAVGGIALRDTPGKLVTLYLQKDLVTLSAHEFDAQANKAPLIKSASAPIQPDTDNLIGVVADSSKITMFVNKTQVLSVDDNSYNIGQSQLFYLEAFDSNIANSGKVSYQKIRIWTV